MRLKATHAGLCVHILSQRYFNSIPKSIRDLIDIVIFNKPDDDRTTRLLSSIYCINPTKLNYIVENKLLTKYDTICIDNTGCYPKLRINLDEVI